ncbi:MAG: PhoH family protein [Lachnospiraceae bacterium]|nr:PhoH family protein [Lachnospiraceae bacterium]
MDQRTVTYRMEMPAEQMRDIFGEGDAYIKQIEDRLHVAIIDRDGFVSVIGKDPEAKKAVALLSELTELSAKGVGATQQRIDYGIEMTKENKEHVLTSMEGDVICHTVNGKVVKPMTLGQKQYVDAIRKNMIVFGLGPAGTGKTYLAMAMAITAFKNEEVGRIILTRPAIEAGEKLGFLPGDMQSKIDPYLRPLYDALYQIMGADAFIRNTEKGLIEVAPLAYMRGRTLDNAFIILDEAQNTTPAQMKMFLTRIGYGSKVIVTGDSTQKDLPKDAVSGLDVAVKVVSGIDDIAICKLSGRDVVRHPLVQKIVNAYEKYEEKNVKRNKKKAPVAKIVKNRNKN